MKRRTFIHHSIAGAAAMTVSPWSTAASYRRILGANDRVRVAMVGCNRRFPGLLGGLSAAENVEIVYVCDVDSRRQEKAVGTVKEAMDKAPKAEKDLRRILDQEGIDAVFHATPDHWHAPGAILTMQAGKHVYVEKPCSHNPLENELLTAWQGATGLVVQMGAQQRSARESQILIKEIHEGILGDPYLAVAFYNNQRGRVPQAKKTPVPDWLDWELFQGPAPRKEFIDILADYNWHWYWHWGTAETGNNATHELDIARWALQVKYPDSVQVNAGKYHFVDDPWTMYDTMDATFNFADNKRIKWDGKSRNGVRTYGGGRGTWIYGTEGSAYVDRDGFTLYDRSGKMIREEKASGKESGLALGGEGKMTNAHVINFLETIRGKQELNCPILEGAISTHLVHYANISYKEGNARLDIDPKTGHFTDKKVQKKHWGRVYADGWGLEMP